VIYLASKSPRRRELLDQIGLAYRVVDASIDESVADHEEPSAYVLRMAKEKAQAGVGVVGSGVLVLGADTAVVVDGRILGKPGDESEALEHLSLLSGRAHQVLSAVAFDGVFQGAHICHSTVTFRVLSDFERRAYWATGEPCDKAGSYAIQGRAAAFVTRLEGSFSAVMGLPLYETAALARAAGLTLLD
jgi:septum formation protein